MRLRQLAGATAGAMVLGTLAVPMIAAPAHAASATAQTPFSATCTWTTRTLTLSGNLAVTVDGASVDATLSATANLGAASLQVSKLASKLTLDIDGESVPVSGESTFAPPAVGNTDIPMPAMTGTRTATAHPGAFDVTAAEVTATIQFGTGVYNCTFADIAPVSFPAPPKDLDLTCSLFSSTFAYKTNLALAAREVSDGKILVTAGLEDMPNTAPPMSLPDSTFVATLGTDIGDLTGTRTGTFVGGAPVAIPDVSTKITGSDTPLEVTVENFSLAVVGSVNITCTLPAAKTFTVAVTPKSQPCIDAEAAVVTAQDDVTTATTAATAATDAVTAATSKVAAATKVATAASKPVTTASKAVSKYTKSVKKYTKAVKKAKGKKAKSKAKKSLSKAKKSLSQAKKALASAKKAKSLADGKLKAAKTQLAAAQSSSTTANSNVAAANAALTAAQNAVDQDC